MRESLLLAAFAAGVACILAAAFLTDIRIGLVLVGAGLVYAANRLTE